MHSIDKASELHKIRKIACLAIILNYSYRQPYYFFLYFRHTLSGFPLVFPPSLYLLPFLPLCMRYLAEIVVATDVLSPKRPREMRCSSLAVKVIH